MRILDRYVLRQWLLVFLVVMFGFPLLVIVIDLTDKLDRYLMRGLTKAHVALAYLYGMPDTMFLVLPAAVLFATVFTVGAMGRYSELTAAKASGVSFHRLVRPIFIAAVASCILGIGLSELVPIGAARKAELLGEKAVRSTGSRVNFVYRADGGWVYAVRTLEIAKREMNDLVMERVGTGLDYPTIVVTAERARYRRMAGWTLQNGRVRFLLGPGLERSFDFHTLSARTLVETPEDLLAEPKAPEEMRYAELGRYIDALARSGSDTRKLAVDRALKIAIPFTCIIIALFGAPLAVTNPRSGAAWGVAVSLATTFLFLLLMQLSRAVGGGGLLPPTFAAWLPNILAAGGAAWLLKKVQT
ncbi:MAG TPA: LptF/LptG family permease [Gemmatimonadales bacterium]|jgi:lipopolysaccharide export system permease protein|nr:LptF/LptG family permease [Gemmatimonadales bacterium]